MKYAASDENTHAPRTGVAITKAAQTSLSTSTISAPISEGLSGGGAGRFITKERSGVSPRLHWKGRARWMLAAYHEGLSARPAYARAHAD